MDQQQAYEVLGSDRESEPGLRNRYYMGKRMTPSAFRVEQDYQVGRRRLINRAINDWGVVQGFAVARTGGRLKVGPGVALDQAGRELVQVGSCALDPRDAFVADEHRDLLHKESHKTSWLLSAHYAERREVAVSSGDGCECEDDEWEYTRETVSYSLRPMRLEEATAAPALGDRYCHCADDGAHRGTTGDRGPHDCLSEALGKREDAGEGEMCKMGRGLRVDIHNSVPLAWVTVAKKDGCDDLEFGEVKDTTMVRRLVIGLRMLYDLIRGRDLTRIESVSWQDWHTHGAVGWDRFSACFPERSLGLTGLRIKFSGPVRKDTLRADCFAIRVTVRDERDGWGETLRVPLLEPQYDEGKHEAILRADPEWIMDEVISARSAFNGGALVEIEVRGDFILDACGQAVDANAIGRRLPTGSGTPGGVFLSSFRVEQRAAAGRRLAEEGVDQANEQPGNAS
jgi:hypothetical protein